MDKAVMIPLRERRRAPTNDDWKSAAGATTRIFMPTLAAPAGWLAGSGELRWRHYGDFSCNNLGSSPAIDLLLGLYSQLVPGGGTTLLFEHQIPLVAAAGATTGMFQWDLIIRPLPTGDATFAQWITSTLVYRRFAADADQTSMFRQRTTIDFSADLLLSTAFQKSVAVANSILDVAQVYAEWVGVDSGI